MPPILMLAVFALQLRAVSRRDGAIVGLLCVIALIYTTPWDNYLVYREVWSYGVDRVVGTIGYVPIEEYLFFVLQPILAGFCLLVTIRIVPETTRHRTSPPPAAPRRIGAGLGLILTLLGAYWITKTSTLYLGLITAWAGPVIAGQWWLAGERFIDRTVWLSVAVPTVYLWTADRIAIQQGIWTISDRYTIGFEPFGLPFEEAVFFLTTNILVVQGIVMFRREGAGRATASSD